MHFADQHPKLYRAFGAVTAAVGIALAVAPPMTAADAAFTEPTPITEIVSQQSDIGDWINNERKRFIAASVYEQELNHSVQGIPDLLHPKLAMSVHFR